MVDGRWRGLFGKLLCLAGTTWSGGFILGAANLPLATAATSSASSGGGEPLSACSAVAERCAADPVCTACTAGIGSRRKARSRRRLQQQTGDGADDDSGQEEEVSTELCSARYPILVTGSSVSFCERVGAAKCCEFSNNDVALACMEGDLAAEYWGCFLMDEVNCALSDMPCHASHRVTVAVTASPTTTPVFVTPSPTVPATPAATAAPTVAPVTPTIAPTAAPSVAASTPSPTAGSRGGLVIPTPSPTAAADAEELDADDVDPEDIDAEGTSGGAARVFERRGTVLAGVVGLGVAFLSAGGALGVPLLAQ